MARLVNLLGIKTIKSVGVMLSNNEYASTKYVANACYCIIALLIRRRWTSERPYNLFVVLLMTRILSIKVLFCEAGTYNGARDPSSDPSPPRGIHPGSCGPRREAPHKQNHKAQATHAGPHNQEC